MPPRGVKKGTKRARQYQKIKRSARQRGASKGRSKQIAARTVQRERARAGQTKTRSGRSTRGLSSSQRGGRRSHQSPTKEQLYRQAKRLRIQGRSKMSKAQLARAVGRKRR
jgi:hypothetical protein